MKTNVNVENILKNDYSVSAQPRLTVDWNLNNYFSPVAHSIYDTDETQGYDTQYFPIESIVEVNRPTSGIQKARINASVVVDGYKEDIRPRFYIGSVDDVYKYWTSPFPTDASTGAFPNHTDGDTTARASVTYAETVTANKIVIKMNVAWAMPNSFDVRIKRNGTWSTISTGPTINNDGTVVLYYNGTAWSVNKPATSTATQTLDAVMIRVFSMKGGINLDGSPFKYLQNTGASVYTEMTTDGKDSHFELISIAAHREADLTDYLITISDTQEVGDASDLFPIGTITTNQGEIQLANYDGIFNAENTSSPYKGLIEPNAQFTLTYVFTKNSIDYTIPGFVMYGGTWAGQRNDIVNITLEDYSKFLKTTFPRPAMWEDLTVNEITWRLLDSVGFVDYEINEDDREIDHLIPVYYCTGESSVWEELDLLAQATQSAIYFDSRGKLQVKTRDNAFDNSVSPVWNFDAEDNTKLADIISFDQVDEVSTNHVTISYQATKWTENKSGVPSFEKVWEPEDTLTLRAAQLVKDLGPNDTKVYISKDDVKIWPYKGIFNIEGEIMKYEGKEYVYFTGDDGATRNIGIVKSRDEETNLKLMTPPAYQYKNHYTGAMQISQRNFRDTESVLHKHTVDASGYSVRSNINGVSKSDVKGFYHNPKDSTVTMYGNSRFKDDKDLLVATRGTVNDDNFWVYGTRLKFEKSSGFKDRRAGIVIHNNGSNEDGYFIDLTTTFKLGAKGRKIRNEVVVYTRTGGKLKSVSGKGTKFAIQDEKEYDIDVFFKISGGNHILTIFIDGKRANTVTISGADKITPNGKFGLYVRGRTKATFEYLYALASAVDAPADDVSWFNMVKGGYSADLWDREWVYGWNYTWGLRHEKKRKGRLNEKFFDDFGPFLHEIREFDVKFDPAPVQHSRIYLTNDWSAAIVEYRSNPFGAYWLVANTIRKNAVINGEDTLSFKQSGGGVNQILTVFGRTLNFADAATVIAKNDDAIRKRGKVDAELSSTWIQSEAMAQEIGDWIVEHFGEGAEEVTMSVFGNPLIEVTDVVNVNYPRRNLNDKYFVTAINSSFQQGLSTQLTLRRVR